MITRTTAPQGRTSNPVAPGKWLVSASAPGVKCAAHPEPIEIAPGGAEAVEITLAAPSDQKRTAPPVPKEKNDGTKAAFYGDVTTAKRIVFVVDKSNSMRGDRFEEAFAELMRSVNYLTPDQHFYVIFFSDAMHPMFEPDAPAELIPASADNRARLETFAADLPHRLGTNAHGSVEKALALKPDVIYLLGDGAFTDDTASYLLNLQGNSIPICTVAFKSLPRGAEVLQRIAERHHGRFAYVP